MEMQTKQSRQLELHSSDGSVTLRFDLQSIKMSDEQRRIVDKLFAQSPAASIALEGHRQSAEAGKPGPASRYLEPHEFEAIRKLGVRLGTKGELVATACDFCLHCVKLEAIPNWNAGIGAS